MTNDERQAEAKKRAAIQRFCALDRAGLIEHDWSEAARTGIVKVRYKPHDVNDFPEIYSPASGEDLPPISAYRCGQGSIGNA